MAEKVVSPGVFTNEIDQSFLPAAIGDIGAAVVGPTVKGPAMVPTVVSSYSEYQKIFGDTFKSGSRYFSYLTSVTAKNYLRHGNRLTVVRVLDGDFSPASASIGMTGGNQSQGSGSLVFIHGTPTSDYVGQEVQVNGVDFTFVSSNANMTNSPTQIFVSTGSDLDGMATNLATAITDAQSTHNLTVSASYGTGNVTQGNLGPGTMSIFSGSYSTISSALFFFIHNLAIK